MSKPTEATCQHCTTWIKNDKGQPERTKIPDIECSVRTTCFDDASTTEHRKEILHEIPA